ncbi:hypothetical protein Tco_0414358 [Tanacetum coccineum]
MSELIAMCVQEEERLKIEKPDIAYLTTTKGHKKNKLTKVLNGKKEILTRQVQVMARNPTLNVDYEVDIIKKTENQAKMTKPTHGKKNTLLKIKPKTKEVKVRVNTEESAVKPEPELKNTVGCNLNPSDGPGKPNSIFMKTVKTKWALNQLQQPICVQLTKTVKTLKAQS